MKGIMYCHYYKYLQGNSKKMHRKLIKWLKKHPEFQGEIKIYNWAQDDGDIDIVIKSDDKEMEK